MHDEVLLPVTEMHLHYNGVVFLTFGAIAFGAI